MPPPPHHRLVETLVGISRWLELAIAVPLLLIGLLTGQCLREDAPEVESPWAPGDCVTLVQAVGQKRVGERYVLGVTGWGRDLDGTMTLVCDDHALVLLRTPLSDSGDLAAGSPARVLARVGEGGVELQQVCLGCRADWTPPTRSAPFDQPVGPALFTLVGWFALALVAVRRQPRPRLEDLGGRAPERFEPEPRLRSLGWRLREVWGPHVTHDGEVIAEGESRAIAWDGSGARSADAASEPGVVLGGAEGYRTATSVGPRLRGPARLNGLEVPAGSEAACAHGDVIEVRGARPVRLDLDGWPEGAVHVRYHLSSTGGLRVLQLVPAGHGRVLAAFVAAAVAGVMTGIAAVPLPVTFLPALLALLLGFRTAAGLRRLAWVDQPATEGRLAIAADDGEGRVLRDADSDHVVGILPTPRSDRGSTWALFRALLAELRAVADRAEGAHGRSEVTDTTRP